MAFGKTAAQKAPEREAQVLENKDAAKLPENNLPAVAGQRAAPSARLARLEEDAGRGVSKDQSDKLVPMIRVLQSQSPQCLRQKPEYIEGARAGDFYLKNTVTPIVLGEEGFDVIPCAFLKCWLEFDGPRDQSPNFVARHEDEKGRPRGIPNLALDEEDGYDYIDREGHRYSLSREHYVLMNGKQPFMFPFGGSGHTTSREWQTLMDNFRLPSGRTEPSFNRKYHVTTTPKSNKSGDWYGIKIEHLGEVTDAEYELAKALNEAVETGAKVAEAPERSDAAAGDKIPF